VCAWACSAGAIAQDLTQSILLNQQSMQSVGNTAGKAPRMPTPQGLPTTTPDHSTIQLVASKVQHPFPQCGCAEPPVFSVASGVLPAGTQVAMTSPTPGATIYYTIDGWTPTDASPRYAEPVPIDASTRLQAIAIVDGKLPSAIAEASYSVDVNRSPKRDKVLAAGGVLLKGTALHLITGEDVSSDTAQVGDRISIRLDEDILVGDTIVAAKGTAVQGRITRVQQVANGGKSGVLSFEVVSMDVHGVSVPMSAKLTLAAPAPAGQRVANASLVHVAGGLPAGDEAEILPGMGLTAVVAADTRIAP
jgi:hypothetical protein